MSALTTASVAACFLRKGFQVRPTPSPRPFLVATYHACKEGKRARKPEEGGEQRYDALPAAKLANVAHECLVHGAGLGQRIRGVLHGMRRMQGRGASTTRSSTLSVLRSIKVTRSVVLRR